MFERITRWAKFSQGARWTVRLQVAPLETRVTPAVMHTLPAYPAPEVFVVAPATLQPPPAPAVETTLPNCRTDLFGLGDGRTNVQADLWEECQAETPAEREATASKPRDEITEPETTSENVNVEVNESHVLFSADGGGESGGE